MRLLWMVALAAAKPPSENPDFRPIGAAGRIPELEQLVEMSGWTSSPTLSGVYAAGRVFEKKGSGLELYSDSCIERAPLVSSYAAAEVVSSLKAGVGVKLAGFGAKAGTEQYKKLVFGAPEQHSIPADSLAPSAACEAKLALLPAEQRARLVVVREALLATIAEQTCGTIDASGRFVVAEAGTSLASACSQESLDPVVVGYHLAPLPLSAAERAEQACVEEAQALVQKKADQRLTTEVTRREAELNKRWLVLRAELQGCLKAGDSGVRATCAAKGEAFLAEASGAKVSLPASAEVVTTACGPRTAAPPVSERAVAFAALGEARTLVGELRSGASEQVWVSPFTGYRLRQLPGGTFTMGSPASEVGRDEDEGQHQVQVKAFQLGEVEVSQAVWRKVMGENPVELREQYYDGKTQGACHSFGGERNLVGDQLPVVCVDWFDAVRFANALSAKDRLTPAYRIEGSQVTPVPGANGYRLPTEAEWEYAAKAGGKHRLYAGAEDATSACAIGNFYDQTAAATLKWEREAFPCSDGYVGTAPVVSFSPNGLGLYHMSGNAWEWTQDWYGPYTEGGPPPTGSHRVFRGGGWPGGPAFSPVSNRSWIEPAYRYAYVGLRLARSVP